MKIIFIHGNGGGSVDDGWYPSLKTSFDKLRIKNLKVSVVSQDFPDSDLARSSIWLPFLEHELHADAESILIGHSLGAEEIIKERLKNM